MECGKPEGNGDNEDNTEPTSVQNACKKTGRRKNKGIAMTQKNKSLLKIFCERHRPFKLIKEITDRQESSIEDLQKF